jgi:hypothetical protein
MKVALLALMFFAAALLNGVASRHSALETWLPFSVVFLLIGAGILARRRWTTAAIFGSAIYVSTTWLTTVALLLLQGQWPYESVVESLVSLVPGLAYGAFWFLMWRLVASHFNAPARARENTSQPR